MKRLVGLVGYGWFFGCFGLAALLGNACVLDSDGFSNPDAGTPGPGPGDASGQNSEGGTPPSTIVPPGSSPPPGSNPDAGLVSVLVNGDMELGCTNWDRGFGEMAEDNKHRNGAESCGLCRGSNFEAFLFQQVKVEVPVGSEWRAEVWLQQNDTDPPEATDLKIVAKVGDTESPGVASIGPVLTSTDWKRIQAVYTSNVAADTIVLQIRTQNGGSCLLADDAVLYRTK